MELRIIGRNFRISTRPNVFYVKIVWRKPKNAQTQPAATHSAVYNLHLTPRPALAELPSKWRGFQESKSRGAG
jgi:hypothetical protein